MNFFNRMTGKTRYVVSRIFLHLSGEEITPLLGILNEAARNAIDNDGDLEIIGEGLVTVCQSLLQRQTYWQSVANEGDVFWNEGDAGDYVTALFTDSAQRYLSEGVGEEEFPQGGLSLPMTRNIVVMITVAFTGEVVDLETDLSNLSALESGLKALINLHHQGKLQAIQIHFSPAKLGDELTNDQLLINFPELVPL